MEEVERPNQTWNRRIGDVGRRTGSSDCEGLLDRVTSIGLPRHRLAELEVRFGLGNRIGQRERFCLLLISGRSTNQGV